MDSPDFTWLFILMCIIPPAMASYAGDNPLETVFVDELPGDFWYSAGNSTYIGSLLPGEQWEMSISPDIPPWADLRYQRLYVYWTWSKRGQEPIYPEMAAYLGTNTTSSLHEAERYVDHKGFAGTNDYYTGMDSYQVPTLPSGEPTSFLVKNTAPDNRTVSIYGAAMLAVWEDSDSPLVQIWVKEGADLLYSSYGISPEMATSSITFDGSVAPLLDVKDARIFLAAPSGGYAREQVPGRNAMMVNCIAEESLPASFGEIFSLMFPGYQGKVWTDVFGGDEMHQIGTEEKDISRYLRVTDNRVEVRDQGDYLLLTNAVLKVTREGKAAP